MRLLRIVLFAVIGGALVGLAIACVAGAKSIPWYYEPGAGVSAQCSCKEVAVGVVNKMLSWQMWGLFIGAIVGLAGGLTLGIVTRKNPLPPAPTPLATP